MEARFPRETERLVLLDFFFFLSSSEELLLEEEAVRGGTVELSATTGSVAVAVVSAGFGVSMLFLGVEPSLAAVAASAAGLPSLELAIVHATGTSECSNCSASLQRDASTIHLIGEM